MPTVAELLSDLTYAFPRHFAKMTAQTKSATLRVYMRELGDVPADVLDAAIREVIRRSEFFPTVGAILAVVAERTLALPTEAEALSQVEARMRWGRQGEDDRGTPPGVHPLVREAVAHVGGYHAFRSTDEQTIIRGQFLRIYRDLRAHALNEAAVRPAALAAGLQRREITQ